jgi:hypothetical protein
MAEFVMTPEQLLQALEEEQSRRVFRECVFLVLVLSLEMLYIGYEIGRRAHARKN